MTPVVVVGWTATFVGAVLGFPQLWRLIRTRSVEAVRSLVATGAGLAILPSLVYRPWSLEGKRIETLTVTDPVTPMSVGLAWHRERAFTPAMQAFRDYFHDAFLAPQQLSARR